MTNNHSKNTTAIIDELASIQHMERGKLTSEYRTRPDTDGDGEITLGPYYKLQAREDGKNRSIRVPIKNVPTMKQDIANYKKFKTLVSNLENSIITSTRELRASQDESLNKSENESKKNSSTK